MDVIRILKCQFNVFVWDSYVDAPTNTHVPQNLVISESELKLLTVMAFNFNKINAYGSVIT